MYVTGSCEGYTFFILRIAEDVLVDDRGYIYFDTANDGLYIVKCTV